MVSSSRRFPISSSISVRVDDRRGVTSRSETSLVTGISAISVRAANTGASVPGQMNYNRGTRTGIFTPDAPLQYDTVYTVNVDAMINASCSCNTDHTFSFKTEESPPGITLVVSRANVTASSSHGRPHTAIVSNINCGGDGCFAALRERCISALSGETTVSSLEEVRLCLLLASGESPPLTEDIDLQSLRERDVIVVHFSTDEVAGSSDDGYTVPLTSIQVPTVSRSELVLEDVLHSGMLSTVYTGQWRSAPVAVKVLRTNTGTESGKMTDAIGRELAVLCGLHHPRILSLMALCKDMEPSEGGTVGLITPLMPLGSLHSLLHSSAEVSRDIAPRFDLSILSNCIRVLLDVCDGMRFLHNSSLVHRDLKSSNILIEASGGAKISDFGLSAFQDVSATHVTGAIGTPAWTAPEVLQGEVARQASDVYSFGVILWELLSREVPWAEKSLFQIVMNVGAQGERLAIPTTFAPRGSASCSTPVKLCEILRNCFGPHTERWSFGVLYAMLYETIIEQLRVESVLKQECPDSFVCPISLVVMQDPVTCSDGHSYERTVIEEWLRLSDKSPMTNETLPSRTLIPNYALRSAIEGHQLL